MLLAGIAPQQHGRDTDHPKKELVEEVEAIQGLWIIGQPEFPLYIDEFLAEFTRTEG